MEYSLKKTITALHIFANKLNAGQPISCYSGTDLKKLPGSDEPSKEESKKPKSLKSNLIATIEYLFFLYNKEHEKVLKSKNLTDNSHAELFLPPLFINNDSLAKARKYCYKTAYNHLLALQHFGIITLKIFHGTKSNFEIYLNSDFLFPPDELRPKNAKKSGKAAPKTQKIEQPLAPLIRENLQHINLSLSDNVKEYNTTQVEKLNGAASRRDVLPAGENLLETPKLTGNPGRPATQENARKEAIQADTEKKAAAAAASLQEQMYVQTVQNALVNDVWNQYEKAFWLDKNFSPEKAKNAIRSGIFNDFQDKYGTWKLEHWINYGQKLLDTIPIIQQYLKDHPGTYLTGPYHEIHPKLGWCHPENKFGFRRIINWVKINEQYGKKNNIWRSLKLAKTVLKASLAPEKCANKKIKKQIQGKTPQQIFHFYKKKISFFGPEAEKKYLDNCRRLSYALKINF